MDTFRIDKKGNIFIQIVEIITSRYAAEVTAFIVGVRADERVVEMVGGFKVNGEGMNFICMVFK